MIGAISGKQLGGIWGSAAMAATRAIMELSVTSEGKVEIGDR